MQYKIISGFDWKKEDGKILRLGPGEELPLEILEDNELLKELVEERAVAELDNEGQIIEQKELNSDGTEIFDEGYLAGLISFKRINEAAVLLENHRISKPGLEVMKTKCEDLFFQGIDKPQLKFVYNLIMEQLQELHVKN